ncbi:hypothetical protein [Sphingobacterium sp.]|uniref:hypothetical protein n=1 Tax=Sphingobacterium sp. TaxID=341027 RepID=UPI002899D956|nr:hypothetical protein [Sphingobacterium sp.]
MVESCFRVRVGLTTASPRIHHGPTTDRSCSHLEPVPTIIRSGGEELAQLPYSFRVSSDAGVAQFSGGTTVPSETRDNADLLIS